MEWNGMEWNGMEWNGIKTFLSKIKNILSTRSLHPFLSCCFIVLHYYNEVEAQCSIIEPIVTLIVLVFLIGACIKLIKYFNCNILVSSIILTFWTFVFFFTMYLIQQVRSCIAFVNNEKGIVPFIIVILGGILITVTVTKVRKTNQLLKLTHYINVLIITFSLIETAKTIYFINHRAAYSKDFYSQDLKPKYNLYILIMDGYARTDNLKKYWNYDNSGFVNFLKEKGFFIVEKSKSNYCLSEQTVCSMLSLNYLKNSQNVIYKTNQIFNNPLFHSATRYGYSCTNLGLFPIKNVENKYDIKLSVKSLYEYIVLQTPLSYYGRLHNNFVDNRLHKVELTKFNALSQVFFSNLEKKLVIFHSMLTHAPYGKIDSTDFHQIMSLNIENDLNWDKYKAQILPKKDISFCRDCYLNQLKVSNALMKKSLEDHWNSISSNSVIILMSDHGFRFVDEKVPLIPSNKEAYENFSAIYFPDKDYHTVHDSMTVLNLARMSVNKAFGYKFEPIMDISNLE